MRKVLVGCLAVAALLFGSTVLSGNAGAVIDSGTIMPTPNVGLPGEETNQLLGVSCISATSCTAVGYYDLGVDGNKLMIQAWDGNSWTIADTPEFGGEHKLWSVSCVSATSCTAVGFIRTVNSNVDESLVMVSNGNTWSRVASPNAGNGVSNELSSVSCLSETSCVAVGRFENGIEYDSLAMIWDGSTWTLTFSPSPGNDNPLESVSCVSATSCMAVGRYHDGQMLQSLAMAWDGSVWTLVPVPFAGVDNNRLLGVSCLSATSCIAVGNFDDNEELRTLVVKWDGSTWQIMSSPNAGIYGQRLESVSCVSATSCTAVGRYSADAGGTRETLVLVWDGSTWEVLESPNNGNIGNTLEDVSCVNDYSCIAVGHYRANSPQTLALSLVGTMPIPETTTTTTGSSDPLVPAFTG